MNVSKRLLALMPALLVAVVVLVGSLGGAGGRVAAQSENKTLTLGSMGWTRRTWPSRT